MALRHWLLTDAPRDIYLDHLSVLPGDVGGSAQGYSIRKRTLRGGLRDGVDLVEIHNGTLQVAVLPTRGMGLWKLRHGDLEIGWNSPVHGPVHPKFVNLAEDSGIGWLSGFDELLCRCGLESNGPPERGEDGHWRYPLHGRIANLPAHRVELSVDGETGDIELTGTVDEARLFHNSLRMRSTVRTRVGQRSIKITDEISNLSARPSELELLYHLNVGSPLLEAGARLVLPLKTMVPRTQVAAEAISGWDRYEAEQVGFQEQVYLTELYTAAEGRTEALLRNAAGDCGLSVHFSTTQLPYFVVWKCTQAAEDGYVTGLEPAINFPNQRSFEQRHGRVQRLAAGESRTFELEIELHVDAGQVAHAARRIAGIAAGREPMIHRQPLNDWTQG